MAKVINHYQGDGLIESHMGKHRVIVDKSYEAGGHDRGPTPVELFIASLGSCVTMVISTYCEEHHIDTTDLRVEMRYETDSSQTRITCVTVDIELPYGEIQYREQALARVAKLCGIHKTIQSLGNIEFTILGKKEIISNIW